MLAAEGDVGERSCAGAGTEDVDSDRTETEMLGVSSPFSLTFITFSLYRLLTSSSTENCSRQNRQTNDDVATRKAVSAEEQNGQAAGKLCRHAKHR